MISGGQDIGSALPAAGAPATATPAPATPATPAASYDKNTTLGKLKDTYCKDEPGKEDCERAMERYLARTCEKAVSAQQLACSTELEAVIKDSYDLATPGVGFHTDDKYPTLADKILGPETDPGGKRTGTGGIAGKYASAAKPAEPPPPATPPTPAPEVPSTEGFYVSVGVTVGTGSPQTVSPVDGTATGQATFTCEPDWPCDPKSKNGGGTPTAKSVTHFYGPRLHLEGGYKFKNNFILGSTLSFLRGQNDDPTNFGNPGWLQAWGIHIGYGFAGEGFVGRVTSGVEYGSFTFLPFLSGPVDRGSAIGGNSDIGMWNINLLKFSIGHQGIKDGHLRLTGGLRTSLDDFLGANRHKINTAVYEGFGMSSDFYLGVEWAFGAQ